MSHSDERIVITGVGTVSSFGTDDQALWAAIRDGISADSIDESFEDAMRIVRVKGYSPGELLGKRGLQFIPESALYLLGASLIAMRDSGWEDHRPDPDRFGIVIGSNFGGYKMSEEYDRITLTEGPRFVSPMQAPNTLANAPASYLAIRLQTRALNTSISTGNCASLDAIGYAITMLKKGNADVVVAGGTEEWNDQVHWYYENAGVLPKSQFDKAGRPFDSQSSGIIPGEGSAAIVLERYKDAKARGATILGEVASWYSSFASPTSMMSSSRGMKRTMMNALQYGGISSEHVGLILSGANGMPNSDQAEDQAIRELFSDRDIPVACIKKTIGEASGASGILQLFAAIRSIQHRVIPATAKEYVSSGLQAGANESQRAWHSTNPRVALLTASDQFGGMSAITIREVLE